MISVQAGQHSSRSSRKFLLSRSGKSESEVEERLSVCQLLDKRLQPRERISSIISDANERREREREKKKKENNRRRLNVAQVLRGETRI